MSHLWPTGSSWGLPLDYGPVLLLKPFGFHPALGFRHVMDTLPSGVLLNGGFRSALACIRLSPSCPFRRLHTLRSLRPARLLTPAFGYGAPHLSARGTLTLLNNVLLSTHKESIRQKSQPRPRFHPAFRLLWVLLSRVWSGWKSAANLMKPKTVLQWHEHAFLQWWRWKSRRKGGRPTIRQEMRALIRRLSRENVPWSAETIHGHLVLLGFRSTLPR